MLCPLHSAAAQINIFTRIQNAILWRSSVYNNKEQPLRVLFLSYWFPYPLSNGSRIRIYNFMKALSSRHQVFLISLLQPESNPEDATALADICTVVSLHQERRFATNSLKSVAGLFSARPRSAVATYDPAVRAAVQQAIKRINPHVIVVSTLGVVEYVLGQEQIPSVLLDHNCEFALLKRSAALVPNRLKRWRYALGWRKFARWEAKICQQFTAVVMPTLDDHAEMRNFAPHLNNIHVIPNGADAEHFDPTQWSPRPEQLLYNGPVTYHANLDAVEYYAAAIYPLLRTKFPQLKLLVTGHTYGADIQRVQECPGIEFTGYVSDIRDLLYQSALCVVPLRKGAGMRLKIPEAMAAGVPVVSTALGAEGLTAQHEEHLLLADTPAAFAAAVERVLTEQALAQRLHTNARRLIEEQYHWPVLGETFTRLVERAATGTHPLHLDPLPA